MTVAVEAASGRAALRPGPRWPRQITFDCDSDGGKVGEAGLVERVEVELQRSSTPSGSGDVHGKWNSAMATTGFPCGSARKARRRSTGQSRRTARRRPGPVRCAWARAGRGRATRGRTRPGRRWVSPAAGSQSRSWCRSLAEKSRRCQRRGRHACPDCAFQQLATARFTPKKCTTRPFFQKHTECLPWRAAQTSAEQFARFAIPADKRQSGANIEPIFMLSKTLS